jgi:hypothetical protein
MEKPWTKMMKKWKQLEKKHEQTWKAMENQGTFWKTYPIVIESYRHKLVWKCLDNQKKQRQFKH